jgi:hypothetical protein
MTDAKEEIVKEFTQDEVSKHTSNESCWLTIGNSNNGTLIGLECEANAVYRIGIKNQSQKTLPYVLGTCRSPYGKYRRFEEKRKA